MTVRVTVCALSRPRTAPQDWTESRSWLPNFFYTHDDDETRDLKLLIGKLLTLLYIVLLLW